MLSYKKWRKFLHGFPARCAGCVLALIMVLSPLTAFADNNAYSFTDETYPFNVAILPDCSDLYIQAKQLNCNIFLFYFPTTQSFKFIAISDFYNSADSQPYQFFTFNDRVICYRYFDYFSPNFEGRVYGSSSANYFCYRCGGIYGDEWTELSLDYSNNTISGYNIADGYLISFDMRSRMLDSTTNEQYLFYGNITTDGVSSTFTPYYSRATQRFYFNSNGQLANSEGGDSAQPEYVNPLRRILEAIQNLPIAFSNAIASIQGWLVNLGATLDNSIGNIQTWLGSLGSTIGGFFSDLWDDLSTGFSNIGTWFSNLWGNLSTAFTNLTNNISTFITVTLPDKIKGLFIPDEDTLSDYKDAFIELLSDRFGGLWDTMEATETLFDSIGDLFDYERVDDFDVKFPRLRVRVDGVYYNLYDENYQSGLFSFSEIFNRLSTIAFAQKGTSAGSFRFSFWSIWDTCIFCIFSLGLFYHLKRQFNRILGILSDVQVGE